jgi:radical SAM protein with 4Fe4S-binding SPASM domain
MTTETRKRIGPEDLAWVDEFIASIRCHVRVRLEDNLLILVPNEAYKLNASGLVILDHLLRGGKISEVLRRVKEHRAKLEQLLYFFLDLCALMKGNMAEGRGRLAVERVSFQVPFNVLPVLSEVAITYRCNLRCRFCYAACGCHARPQKDAEMTTQEAMKILDIIAHEAKAPSVSFTGGEPTLRNDLPKLVAHARSLDLRVNLITNGTTADGGLVERLAKAGLNSAQVSLEAATPDTHEKLTGVPGSFAATLRGIENLRKAAIHAHTNTTINRLNLNELSALLRLVKDLGMTRLSMNMVIPTGSAAAHDDELMVSYTEIGPIVRRLADEARGLGMKFMWYSPTPLCLFNPIAEGLGNKSCAACDGLLSVAPDGGLRPCSSHPETIGNLLTEDFAAVWNSTRAKYFKSKDFAPEPCKTCEDFAPCACACPLYWERQGYDELRQAHAARSNELMKHGGK